MLCVMHMVDKFEAKEATKLVNFPKCVKQVLDEFVNVMLEELSPRRQVDHAIKVMSKMTPPTKVPY